ncbi:MAG TPA: cache domain-containing protein [Clostridia bacterium]|nr:cache domain-containing protein [Clostridia bacterium]
MKKADLKLVMIHIIFAFASVFLTVFISYRTVNGILLEHAFSVGTACAETEAEEIDSWLKGKTALLKSTAVQIENTEPGDEGYMMRILENAVKTDPSFYSFFLGFEDGSLMDANGWIPPDGYNTLERPWYQEASAANGLVFTSAYIDVKKNTQVKAIAIPLHIQGKNAVLAANIPFDVIRKQIEGIRFGETGYGVLTDDAGIVLVYPDEKNGSKAMEAFQEYINVQIQENTWKGGKGTTVIRSGEQKALLVQVPIMTNGWRLFLLAPLEEFQGPAKKMSSRLLITISFLMGLMITISYLLGRRLSKQPDEETKPAVVIAGSDSCKESGTSDDAFEKVCCNEAPVRKERYIAGTEEVYDIAGQIDETAVQLEKEIKAFKIRQ